MQRKLRGTQARKMSRQMYSILHLRARAHSLTLSHSLTLTRFLSYLHQGKVCDPTCRRWQRLDANVKPTRNEHNHGDGVRQDRRDLRRRRDRTVCMCFCVFLCLVCVLSICVIQAFSFLSPPSLSSCSLSHSLSSTPTHTNLPDGHAQRHRSYRFQGNDAHKDKEAIHLRTQICQPIDNGAQDQRTNQMERQLAEELYCYMCVGLCVCMFVVCVYIFSK